MYDKSIYSKACNKIVIQYLKALKIILPEYETQIDSIIKYVKFITKFNTNYLVNTIKEEFKNKKTLLKLIKEKNDKSIILLYANPTENIKKMILIWYSLTPKNKATLWLYINNIIRTI